MLEVVNAWLHPAREDGTIDELYDYWVQGKIGARKPARGSVIRNVLHWVDQGADSWPGTPFGRG